VVCPCTYGSSSCAPRADKAATHNPARPAGAPGAGRGQSIYLLPRGTALDAGTQTPVAVFNDNTTGEWTGNESLIADSKGNPLTSIDYSIYVVSNGFQKIQASTDISIASEGIATSGIPAGKVGAAYSFTMSATGGSLPYSWTAAGLPEGLSMTTGGAISGVPTSSGTFSAVITVEDSASLTNSKPFEITILPALSSGGEHSVSKLNSKEYYLFLKQLLVFSIRKLFKK
jgi:hypothetical protein